MFYLKDVDRFHAVARDVSFLEAGQPAYRYLLGFSIQIEKLYVIATTKKSWNSFMLC
jgi:hypothetical protein